MNGTSGISDLVIVFLKTTAFMAPSIIYLLYSISVWKGRTFGPVGRARFAVIGFVVGVVLMGIILGGMCGAVLFDWGPGENCRELACLVGIIWFLGGAATGLLLGVSAAVVFRRFAKTHPVAFFAPSVAAFLISAAAAILNSDMFR